MRADVHRLQTAIASMLTERSDPVFVGVASLGEVAVRTRPGKPDSPVPPAEFGGCLANAGCQLPPIKATDVVTEVAPAPASRYPFDRLLLAQCAVEGMRLITLDRSLAGHPLSATR